METDALPVGVIMQRLPLANRWQSHQWRPLEILIAPPPGTPTQLRADADDKRWLFSGFEIRLFTGEAEGYLLNVSSPAPCWFVMSRMEEIDGEEVSVPKAVTLSYNEAARLTDGGESVDTVPADATIIERMQAFVDEHYRPEPKKKRKKPSFEGGAAVQRMADEEGKQHGGQ